MRYLFQSITALSLLLIVIGCDQRPGDRLTLNDDTAVVMSGESVEINATANDTFDAHANEHNIHILLDDQPLALSSPSKGTAVIHSGNNTIIYTANPGAIGDDNFTYHAYATGQRDGTNGTMEDFSTSDRQAIVTIHITETENARPVAETQEVELDCNVPVAPHVDINLTATDADGDPLSYAIVRSPTRGTLSPISGNSVTYTANPSPNICDSGNPDSFGFRANDGFEDSIEANVTLVPINN